MQNNDRQPGTPAIVEKTMCPENGRTDLAQAEAAKTETAPLVDGPLFLRCFANSPNAFVS
jgi:hypothetical protein